jgi:hypothetical protein
MSSLIDTYEKKAPRTKNDDPRIIPFCLFTYGRVKTPAPRDVVTRTKIIPLREPLLQ